MQIPEGNYVRQEELKLVLEREAATTARYDARLDELERAAVPPRLLELALTLAYEFAVSVCESDLTAVEGEAAGWFDRDSDTRTDELVPECLEYLELRGLLQISDVYPQWFAIRDESEATQ